MGQPTATYVRRENGRYESALASALDARGKLCLLTETGKTTLYSRVLKDRQLQALVVRCDSSVTAEEFWRRALEKIDFQRLTSVQDSKSEKVVGTGKVGGKIGWAWLAGLLGEVSVGIESTMGEVQIREKILSQPSPDHLIPVLTHLSAVLVVEDFHYLDTKVKKNVFQQWKVFVDQEVSVIVVGTTHHAVDLAYANRDLVGRISQIDVSTWSQADLEQIAIQGFAALKLNVSRLITAAIARESASLPIVVQETCSQLLTSKGLTEIEPGQTRVSLERSDVYTSLHSVAKTHYGQFEALYERYL